ncbi:MAG: hypothetical protein U9N85_05350 [Bacteroidota bacterium]|nr:hypothetical protein [Bacteroidota bacterium]
MRLRLLLMLIVGLAFTDVHAQAEEKRLRVDYGGTLPVIFDSLDDIGTGLTFTNYTQLHIVYTDTTALGAPEGNGWQLTVKPQSQISGTGANVLPYNVVKLILTVDGTPPVPDTFFLTAAEQTLTFKDENVVTEIHNIQISYEIGTDNSLAGYTPDRYTVVLEFTLEEHP